MRLLAAVVLGMTLAGCASIPMSGQPGLAANSGWCAVMAGGIAQAVTSSVPIAGAAIAGAAAACSAEAAVVSRPANSTTTTTTTVTSVSKS